MLFPLWPCYFIWYWEMTHLISKMTTTIRCQPLQNWVAWAGLQELVQQEEKKQTISPWPDCCSGYSILVLLQHASVHKCLQCTWIFLRGKVFLSHVMGHVNRAQRGHMVLKLPKNLALEMPLFYKGGESCQGKPKDGAEVLIGHCGNKWTPLV